MLAAALFVLASFAHAEEPNPVLTQLQGHVRLLEPAPKYGDPIKGVLARFEGKMVEVVDAKPGDAVPNGSIIQTFPGAKAKMVLANGDSFLAAGASQVGLNWNSLKDGKVALDVNLRAGLIHGVVQKSNDLAVNVVTKTLKAVIPGADFFLGALESLGVKDPIGKAVGGAVLKITKGLAKLWPWGGSDDEDEKKPIEVAAGAEVVTGMPQGSGSQDAASPLPVPVLSMEGLLQATSLDPSQLIQVDPSRAAMIGAMDQRADGATTAVGGLQGRQAGAGCKGGGNPIVAQLQGSLEIISKVGKGIFKSQDAQPGDCVENGAFVRTGDNSKAKLVFANGNQIFAGDKTELGLNWAKGKLGDKLGITLNGGSIRGIFEANKGVAVTLITNAIKAVIPGADLFVTTLENLGVLKPGQLADAASAVVGTGLKVLSGLAKLWPWGGSSDEAPTEVKAGEKVVVAANAPDSAVEASVPAPAPLNAADIEALKVATTPDQTRLQPVPPENAAAVAQAEKRAEEVQRVSAPSEARVPAPQAQEWSEDSNEPEESAHKKYVNPNGK